MYILGEFIGFEPVTLVPFEPKLIDFTMMEVPQIEWYNQYGETIRNTISPHFEDLGRDDILDWINSKTAYVDPSVSHLVQNYVK